MSAILRCPLTTCPFPIRKELQGDRFCLQEVRFPAYVETRSATLARIGMIDIGVGDHWLDAH